MKTIKIFIMLMFAALTMNAQWTKVESVDEFGDGEGTYYRQQETTGTFTNSVTLNGKCDIYMMWKHEERTFAILILPYGNVASWYEDGNQIIKIKTPAGHLHTMNVFATKKGVLVFTEEDYDAITLCLTEFGTFKSVFRISNDYIDETYKFNIEM